jgi:hypothetical protein
MAHLKTFLNMERKASNKKEPGNATPEQNTAGNRVGNGGASGNGGNSGAGGNGGSSRNEQLAMEDIPTESIAARAYEIYERDGRVDGKDMEHWLRAESELRSERESSGSSASEAASRNVGNAARSAGGNPQNPQTAQNAPRSARRHQAGAAA